MRRLTVILMLCLSAPAAAQSNFTKIDPDLANLSTAVKTTSDVAAGTTTAARRLTVVPSGAGPAARFALSSGHTGIEIIGNAASATYLHFGASGDEASLEGGITYDNPSGLMTFNTVNGGTQLRLNSSGLGVLTPVVRALTVAAPANEAAARFVRTTGGTGIEISSNAASQSFVHFTDPGDEATAEGQILYNNSTDTMTLNATHNAGHVTLTASALTSIVPINGLKSVTNDTDGAALTAAQCRGHTYTNTGAGAGQTFDLPAAAVGMHVRFYVSAAQNVVVNPDASDQILSLTNAVGDSITASTIGNCVELIAIDSTNWAAVSVVGTWTDTD